MGSIRYPFCLRCKATCLIRADFPDPEFPVISTHWFFSTPASTVSVTAVLAYFSSFFSQSCIFFSWSSTMVYKKYIYNYLSCNHYNLCNQCPSPLMLWVRISLRWGVLYTTLCDKVCQWLAVGQWFSPGTPDSLTNKTYCNDITEILLKVVLNTITPNPNKIWTFWILAYNTHPGRQLFFWPNKQG